MAKDKDVKEIVGKRLKSLRQGKGLSLSSLAKKAGISKATLSILEEGKGNPTISTLWALADALEVPFGKLIDALDEDQSSTVGEKGISVRLIEHTEGPPPIDAYHMVFEPQSSREAEPHPLGVIEKITVLKGYMLVGPAEAPKKIRAGETYTFKADCPHVYIALSEPTSAVLVLIYPSEESHG
ncbi:helix-turn-helix domain protein [Thermodesulfatator indicus DSM 15286]|uniref:Helix-turn-helix domain protein n=1 Tax=Thermodesulfatator indicus (strain DSM 15286 / JCM 11887 / CIR29812) TaxID=667014 RepID=F8A8L7_THEID|nr:helix-turn-helix domain-containing protein [Thermodesulfatator indicus]AEH45105.1 helix-turn-helix domain protein [Thermodesulfatator indicus DSM 15286]